MAKILARLSAAHIGRPYRYQLAGVSAEFVGNLVCTKLPAADLGAGSRKIKPPERG
jgi:hypothetical protein